MNRTTQRFVHSSLALILLLAIAGCSGREPSYPEQSNTTPTALDITDLKEILSTLDASNATLTYYNGENEETYPANAAIRAEKYITELQNYNYRIMICGRFVSRQNTGVPTATATIRSMAMAYRLLPTETDLKEFALSM